MRTKLIAAAALLAAGIASSMAQSNVYSLNVVGYVNKVIGANGYTAIANPLNATNNSFNSLFTGLPSGTEVLKFNPSIADYDIYDKIGTTWVPNGTVTLAPGEGCLILNGPGSVTNTFVGEVLQGSQAISFVSGYQQAGNKIPDSGDINTLGMTNAPSGAELLKWNFGIQDFDIYDKLGTTWVPSTPVLDVGESFILLSGTTWTWTRNFTVQ